MAQIDSHSQLITDFKISKSFLDHFSKVWNVVEFVNLGVSSQTVCCSHEWLYVASVVMYLTFIIQAGANPIKLTNESTEYPSYLEAIALNAIAYYEVSAFNILLTTFKTFKYLRINKKLYVLWDTIDSAKGSLATFLFIFLIILLGFVFMGWLTFGADLNYFNGFAGAIGTCWNFLIGNPPSYLELMQVNRSLGPVVSIVVH